MESIKNSKPVQKLPPFIRTNLLLVSSVVFFVLLTGAVYSISRQTPEKAADTHDAVSSELSPRLTVEDELNQIKAHIADIDSVPQDERQMVYSSAAFAAAKLRYDEAAEYASKAVELLPQEFLANEENRNYVNVLKAIANGDYSAVPDLSAR